MGTGLAWMQPIAMPAPTPRTPTPRTTHTRRHITMMQFVQGHMQQTQKEVKPFVQPLWCYARCPSTRVDDTP